MILNMFDLICDYKNSICESLCDYIINEFDKSENKSLGITGSGINKNVKNSNDLNIFNYNENIVWQSTVDTLCEELNNKLCKYKEDLKKNYLCDFDSLNVENLQFNTLQIQRYNKNEGKYEYHNDYFAEDNRSRLITFIWYLNTVEIGGETEFFGNKKIKCEKGKLVLFPATWTYMHKGCVPISENKYIITGWIYGPLPVLRNNKSLNDNIKYNRFYQRFKHEKLITENMCDWIISEYETYANNNNGWTTDRHGGAPTTDLPVKCIPNILNFLLILFDKTISNYIIKDYCLTDTSKMNITDIFIVKYEEHNQTSLEKHVDESTVSVIITLSNINDYEGGGTKFEDDIIVKQNKGDILIFSKLHSHSAISIKKGKRYVLTYFIDIENS